jgi:hypothetical protein
MRRSLSLLPRRPILAICLSLLATVCAACAEPPSKEMNQAQGAIDAARAAGAERFASTELAAAIEALAQAETAVSARDYRLALAHSLASREHAQSAAKAAVESRARARGDAERALSQVATLIERLATRLEDAEVARLPRRTLAPAEGAITSARRALQEARAKLESEDYDAAVGRVDGVARALQAALQSIDAAAARPTKGRAR